MLHPDVSRLKHSLGRFKLQELRAFHTYHTTLGSAHFSMLPSEDGMVGR